MNLNIPAQWTVNSRLHNCSANSYYATAFHCHVHSLCGATMRLNSFESFLVRTCVIISYRCDLVNQCSQTERLFIVTGLIKSVWLFGGCLFVLNVCSVEKKGCLCYVAWRCQVSRCDSFGRIVQCVRWQSFVIDCRPGSATAPAVRGWCQ